VLAAMASRRTVTIGFLVVVHRATRGVMAATPLGMSPDVLCVMCKRWNRFTWGDLSRAPRLATCECGETMTFDGFVAPAREVDDYPERLFRMQPAQRVAGVHRKVVGNEVRFRQHGIASWIGKTVVITSKTLEERLPWKRNSIPLAHVRGFAPMQRFEWKGDCPTWVAWGVHAWLETQVVWMFAFDRFDHAADLAIQLNEALHARRDVIQPAHAQRAPDQPALRV
jgi:hypothetical protein